MGKILPNLTELEELTGDKQQFLLRVVQPGLSGLMDGSMYFTQCANYPLFLTPA